MPPEPAEIYLKGAVKDVLADKQEMGTITIKTNRTDLNGEQIYAIWKQINMLL